MSNLGVFCTKTAKYRVLCKFKKFQNLDKSDQKLSRCLKFQKKVFGARMYKFTCFSYENCLLGLLGLLTGFTCKFKRFQILEKSDKKLSQFFRFHTKFFGARMYKFRCSSY